jgi:hypothetical protein
VAGLARRFGAAYARYAGDLAFSGDDDFARNAPTFIAAIGDVVADEGASLSIHARPDSCR